MKFNFINLEKLKFEELQIDRKILSKILEKIEFPINKSNKEFVQIEKKYDKLEKQVNVIFVSLEEITEINKEWRGKNQATDVLSFNINEIELFGELYISLDYIKKNYLKYETSFDREVLRLIIHGVLHLYGFDHETEFTQQRVSGIEEEMFLIQEKLLKQILDKVNKKVK
jgi:rRNA maturation RNase YbeY